MPENISRVGQRVDKIRVHDEHENYRQYDPWTAELIATYDRNGNVIHGLPILTNTETGNYIEKSVESYTVTCPDCSIPAKFDHASDPVCPECGLICDGQQGKEVSRSERLVMDAIAAERVIDDSNPHL